MKTLLLLPALLLLVSCGDPAPMNSFTSQSYDACLKKNWEPTYFSNGMKTEVRCEPVRDPIPMNEHASTAMSACLNEDKNAVYDAPTGRVVCVQEGGNLQIK